MRPVELSQHAQERLTEITDYYLLHESVERTLKVLNSFDEAFNKIRDNPFLYKRYISREFISLDIRIYLHYKTYHIYFVIYPDAIKVAEIFHLKRHPGKLNLKL
jgi:plasmid stabilization system protein ParE